MEQQTQKKEWKTPELIVLVRSKPEEAVLTACRLYVIWLGGAALKMDRAGSAFAFRNDFRCVP